MSAPEVMMCLLLGLGLLLFMLGRPRYDIVALLLLVLAVVGGLVPVEDAFSGFGHGAVITVAMVLILSDVIERSGAVRRLAGKYLPRSDSVTLNLLMLMTVGAGVSAFINNIGALALMMPLAFSTAARLKVSPALFLMPISYATLLGGTVTLIGTPPNIIASHYRETVAGAGYAMFDFAWAGLPLTVLGVAVLALVGWRLVRVRNTAPQVGSSAITQFLSELRVGAASPLLGQTVQEAEKLLEVKLITLLGIERGKQWIPALANWEKLTEGDLIVVESAPEALALLDRKLGLLPAARDHRFKLPGDSSEMTAVEIVIQPHSPLIGQTAAELRLRSRYFVNLIGIWRGGARPEGALRSIPLEAGDVLLLQGSQAQLQEALQNFEALTLQERPLPNNEPMAQRWALPIFALAVATIAFTSWSPPVVLTGAVVVLALLGAIRPRHLYRGVDWSVIMLLGAMIPIGSAMESSGLATSLAGLLTNLVGGYGELVALMTLMAVTILLTALLNNSAAVLMLAPIAWQMATALGSSPDAFLLGITLAASCDFLTPIGHQNNAVIMGPGGYRFGDYWRPGLPLVAIVILLGAPLLLAVWG